MSTNNTNENCLKGMSCPNCGSFGPFDITGTTTATMFDDGVDEFEGLEYDSTAPCSCKECSHAATIGEFRGQEKERRFILIQEGGSSTELYIHAWDSEEAAEQDRIDCSRDGAYRTSPVLEIPASLASHPEFYEVVENILGQLQELECVEVEE